MSGAEWIDEFQAQICVKLAGVEVFRVEPGTVSLALGTRSVTVHEEKKFIWLAPTFAAGGSIASRLRDRVQHMDVIQLAVNEKSLTEALDIVLAHLRP